MTEKFEDDLTRRLHERVGDIAPTHDWEEVAGGADRRHRRSRAGVMAACAVVSLGVGTGAFLVGRATAPAGSELAAGTASVDRVEPPTTVAVPTTVVVPTTAAPVPAATVAPWEGETAATTAAAAAADEVYIEGYPGQGGPGSGIGILNEGAYEEPTLPLFGERTTTSGVTMRAYLQSNGGPSVISGGDGWTPASWCQPTGYFRVSIVSPTALAVTGGSWYAEPKDGLAVSTFAAGYVEGTPIFGATVQVSSDVTMVAFALPDGRSDAVAPTNGLALVAVDGPLGTDFSITLTLMDGATRTVQRSEMLGVFDEGAYIAACQPPTSLPAPGEQPADADAVEQSIRDVHAKLYSGVREPGVGELYIDDMTGIADAVARLDSGQYAENAKTARREITGFVFTSPTEAWFRYDIVTDLAGRFEGRFGLVRLQPDGTWKFSRQSICQDLALAPGAECDPPVPTLYPLQA